MFKEHSSTASLRSNASGFKGGLPPRTATAVPIRAPSAAAAPAVAYGGGGASFTSNGAVYGKAANPFYAASSVQGQAYRTASNATLVNAASAASSRLGSPVSSAHDGGAPLSRHSSIPAFMPRSASIAPPGTGFNSGSGGGSGVNGAAGFTALGKYFASERDGVTFEAVARLEEDANRLLNEQYDLREGAERIARTLSADNEDLRRRIAHLQGQITELQQRGDRLISENRRLSMGQGPNAADLRLRVEEAQGTIAELEARLAEASVPVTLYQTKIAELQRRGDELEAARVQLTADVQRMSALAAEAQHTAKRLEKTEAELTATKQQLQQARDALEKLNLQHAEHLRRFNRVVDERKELEERHATAAQQLNAAREQLVKLESQLQIETAAREATERLVETERRHALDAQAKANARVAGFGVQLNAAKAELAHHDAVANELAAALLLHGALQQQLVGERESARKRAIATRDELAAEAQRDVEAATAAATEVVERTMGQLEQAEARVEQLQALSMRLQSENGALRATIAQLEETVAAAAAAAGERAMTTSPAPAQPPSTAPPSVSRAEFGMMTTPIAASAKQRDSARIAVAQQETQTMPQRPSVVAAQPPAVVVADVATSPAPAPMQHAVPQQPPASPVPLTAARLSPRREDLVAAAILQQAAFVTARSAVAAAAAAASSPQRSPTQPPPPEQRPQPQSSSGVAASTEMTPRARSSTAAIEFGTPGGAERVAELELEVARLRSLAERHEATAARAAASVRDEVGAREAEFAAATAKLRAELADARRAAADAAALAQQLQVEAEAHVHRHASLADESFGDLFADDDGGRRQRPSASDADMAHGSYDHLSAAEHVADGVARSSQPTGRDPVDVLRAKLARRDSTVHDLRVSLRKMMRRVETLEANHVMQLGAVHRSSTARVDTMHKELSRIQSLILAEAQQAQALAQAQRRPAADPEDARPKAKARGEQQQQQAGARGRSTPRQSTVIAATAEPSASASTTGAGGSGTGSAAMPPPTPLMTDEEVLQGLGSQGAAAAGVTGATGEAASPLPRPSGVAAAPATAASSPKGKSQSPTRAPRPSMRLSGPAPKTPRAKSPAPRSSATPAAKKKPSATPKRGGSRSPPKASPRKSAKKSPSTSPKKGGKSKSAAAAAVVAAAKPKGRK